ncbi:MULTISPECIES: fumarylacetoacetase [Ramlibacter]|uniref:fumarylacetoacetase n=1 Tax=Ramlibacter pinisoli TaxID=2682844 RepID=A0A6N8INX7_9BURK|nr:MULTISPECIES: fumarylacetoacetase [Ramlibacter]MBA2960605.1 fumarylacetoacetase [Ramlibacter sp. CGMCC 1.13660]MVQ27936.1 fumarylacetoacetase [Ramlibacter pinisoli]
MLDFTHDPQARSWVAAAQAAGCDFPLQNLPHGVFARIGRHEPPRGGVAIGDQVLDLARLAATGVLQGEPQVACEVAARETLNAYMGLGLPAWRSLRRALFRLLSDQADAATQERLKACLVPLAQAEMKLPVEVRNYTDFYTSVHHATNVGKVVRPDDPLTPNFKWLPIAYHGRASSVVASGTAYHRPRGQAMAPGAAAPVYGPCRRLDFELEMGFFVGPDTVLGQPIPLAEAADHIFGMCLLNDWSARDHQFWEMNPLGPFLGKNFCTSISPWVVTMEALAPFRVPFARPAGDPQPLAYLDDASDRAQGSLDIQLEVRLQSHKHRAQGRDGDRITATSFRHQYWTVAQMLAQHTVGGCNVCSGDLMGTGTISGPTAGEAGAIVELSVGGTRDVPLPSTGEVRRFLEDGDCVILQGWCEKPGAARIGFGECRGTILPALD